MGNAFRSTGAVPHSGSAYVIIADGNNEGGLIHQYITIPANNRARLIFWLSISSEETSTVTAYDVFFVEIRNASGQLLERLDVFSNLDKGNGSYSAHGYTLDKYAGQGIRIQFFAQNNGSRPTKFRVDDVIVF